MKTYLTARLVGDGTKSGTHVEILDEDANVLGELVGVSGVQFSLTADRPFVRRTTVAIDGCEWNIQTNQE